MFFVSAKDKWHWDSFCKSTKQGIFWQEVQSGTVTHIHDVKSAFVLLTENKVNPTSAVGEK